MKELTPMEQAQKFAKDLATSLRLQVSLKELEDLPPEQRELPENRLIEELLIKAIILNGDKSEPIEG